MSRQSDAAQLSKRRMSAKRVASECAACGARVNGKFCSECGAPSSRRRCLRCDEPLVEDAKFCGECGSAAGAQATFVARWLTWPRAVGGLSVLALVVVVTARFASRTQPPDRASALAATGAPTAEISNLSPREAAARLYDRVMRLREEGKTDSVAFFAPMALTVYARIPDMDADARYDMARIAIAAGEMAIARAQADTMLRADSTHLLGLLLGADVARAANDDARAKRLETLFVGSVDRERVRTLPEYEAHGREIASALDRLRAAAKK